MADILVKTVFAIEQCKSHLKDTNSYGSPVESYLAQYVLVVLYSDIQQELNKIISNMAGTVANKTIEQFILSSRDRNLRSITKTNLAEFVGMFGDSVKMKFNKGLNDRDVTIYNNAVFDRHDVAHSIGAQITFSELKDAVKAARKILFAFKSSLP